MARLLISVDGHIRFSETWPVRRIEWMLAIVLFGVGLIYGFSDKLFDMPLYKSHLHVLPQPAWAFGCTLIALLRSAGLFINGWWRRSPHLRAFSAFLACFAWFELSVAVLQAPALAATVAVWPVFLVFDIGIAVSAASEAGRSDVRHTKLIEDEERGGSVSV